MSHVLFVCIQNAGRSQNAQALFEQAAAGRHEARSAGSCPYIPGKRYIDWELPDPAGQPPVAVRAIRDEISARVQGLVTDLATR